MKKMAKTTVTWGRIGLRNIKKLGMINAGHKNEYRDIIRPLRMTRIAAGGLGVSDKL